MVEQYRTFRLLGPPVRIKGVIRPKLRARIHRQFVTVNRRLTKLTSTRPVSRFSGATTDDLFRRTTRVNQFRTRVFHRFFRQRLPNMINGGMVRHTINTISTILINRLQHNNTKRRLMIVQNHGRLRRGRGIPRTHSTLNVDSALRRYRYLTGHAFTTGLSTMLHAFGRQYRNFRFNRRRVTTIRRLVDRISRRITLKRRFIFNSLTSPIIQRI